MNKTGKFSPDTRIILILLIFTASAGIQLSSETPHTHTRVFYSISAQEETRNLHIRPRQGLYAPVIFSEEIENTTLISHYIEKYSSPAWLKFLSSCLEKGSIYRDYIISRIEYHDLPPELVYLPIVESAYNIYAVSRSGAAGLWQFMMNSIGPYDMSVTEWMDERRDFWKATDGSLRKLKYNYEKLGDWLLALAAYNCGLGKMTRTIEQTGINDFHLLAEGEHLPVETIHYIPKFLAVSSICSYAGRNGIDTTWPEPFHWKRIKLDQAVDLKILAEEADIPLSILKSGNAELRFGITPPISSGYFLKVPVKYADSVTETLQKKRLKLMRFYMHKIESGNTLYNLAKHFGVSVEMIEKYNPGIEARSLGIGRNVVIPAIKEIGPYPGNPPPAETRISAETAMLLAGGEVYTVNKGDTLWSISRKFNITPEEIASNNGIGVTEVIKTGQLLQIPEPLDIPEHIMDRETENVN